MREFETGATRDTAEGKPQYEGYLSPLVLHRFGQYMLEHQVQADGQQRAADNWQKGMGQDVYMDSKLRHDMDVWLHHRGYPDLAREDLESALCAILFNVQGMLHELLEAKTGRKMEPRDMIERATGLREDMEAYWADYFARGCTNPACSHPACL